MICLNGTHETPALERWVPAVFFDVVGAVIAFAVADVGSVGY